MLQVLSNKEKCDECMIFIIIEMKESVPDDINSILNFIICVKDI